MSDIRIYSEANMPTSPLTGDVVLCTGEYNGAPANSVHLCTNATGPLWKSFANDGAITPPPFNQYCLSFDGSDDYLNVGSNILFNTSQPFSGSAWVYVNDYSPQFPTLFNLKTEQSAGFTFGVSNYLTSNYRYAGFWFGSDQGVGISTADVALANSLLGGWHHVAFTYDGVSYSSISSYKLYIDGTDTTITTVRPNLLDGVGLPANDNLIGAKPGNAGSYLDGKIDEIALFSFALTSEQVASLIDSSGANPVPADISGLSPSAWWRMGDDANDTFVDGGSVSSITDSSGNGNTATQATASNQPTFSTSVPA